MRFKSSPISPKVMWGGDSGLNYPDAHCQSLAISPAARGNSGSLLERGFGWNADRFVPFRELSERPKETGC